MSKFSTRSVVMLAGVVAGSALAPAPGAFAEQRVHHIVYRVTGPQASLPFGPGPGSVVQIAYKTPGADASPRPLALPWNLVFQAKGGDAELASTLRITVTQPDPDEITGATYACEISVDGEVREHAESDLDGSSLECFLGDAGND